MRTIMAVIAMYPLVDLLHYSPYDVVVVRNVIVPSEDFPIFLDVSIWPDDSETKPTNQMKNETFSSIELKVNVTMLIPFHTSSVKRLK